MTHLNDETLQRILHGELDAGGIENAQHHLVCCAACRERVDAARDEEAAILALLSGLDKPPVSLSPARVFAPVAHRTRTWSRLAAMLALSAGALAAAYIAPGSPLRRATVSSTTILPRSASVPREASIRQDAGVSVDPGRALSIVFAASQSSGTVVVSLVAGDQVDVRTVEGGARFTVGEHQVLIDNHASSADFVVRVGRDAAWVDIRLDTRRLLLKSGNRITAAVAANTAQRYRFPLRPR